MRCLDVRRYDFTGGGGTPIFYHRFCANLVSGPGEQWGFKPPKPPVASTLGDSQHTSLAPDKELNNLILYDRFSMSPCTEVTNF